MKFQSRILLIEILLFLGISLNAYANPQGENVVAGTATFDRSTPNTLTVNTTSNNTIINYNSFSIAANETTRFNQPSISSAVLNRVIGADPSAIYGTLSSNGKLFLVNPNGIIFGPNSSVNAPAVVASTLDISNNDFLNGNYNFYQNGGSSFIINQGRLAATPGGYIALLSQAVNNQGIIVAPLGTVALATGEQMTLGLDSQSQISVVVNQAVPIQANGGKVLLTAKVLNDVFDNAVNNSGVIEANSLQGITGTLQVAASGAPVVNTGTIQASNVDLISDGDIYSLGVLESSSLIERGNTFQVGGIFNPGYADVKNTDNAIVYAADTNVSGTITDPANITINPDVTLTMVGNTSFNAGSAFNMDPTATIAGGGYNLSISAEGNSTLGNINSVNLLTLSLTSGTTPVTFTSSPSATFQVNTVKTNYGSILSRNVGTGTSADPIMIYSDSNTPGGLQYIPTSGLGLYYELANNIDASETSSWNGGQGFVPIGNNITPFSGNFNGNFNAISGLYINLPSTSYAGLFGYTNSSANISNTGIVNDNIIAGQNNITLVGSEGGLVGWNGGSITNSYSTGSVSGSLSGSGNANVGIGGLVGVNSGSITKSFNLGSVSSVDSVNLSGVGVGGLVGENQGTISNSYNTGSVSGDGQVAEGGLVGFTNGASIANSYNTGNISGSGAFLGGLVGLNIGSISNGYNAGGISGSATYVGGLIGQNVNGLITNSYNAGSVVRSSGSLNSWVGGLIGQSTGGSITNTYNIGNISGNGEYEGGLIGQNQSSITNSYNIGNVSSSGVFAVGGLVGANQSSIANSYNTGNVSGSSEFIGGLIGDNGGPALSNSAWWTGAAANAIGSLPGKSLSSLGYGTDEAALSNFYSTSEPVYAIGTAGGWDFTNTWAMPGSAYPVLQAFSGGPDIWSGTTSSNWFTASNWVGDLVPGAGANITINVGINNPILNSNISSSDLLIEPGAVFNPGTFTITGTNLDDYGTLLVNTSTFAGNYVFSGATALETGSTVNYAGLANQTITHTLPYYNLISSGSSNKILDGTTTVGGSLTNDSILDLNAQSLTVKGDLNNFGTLKLVGNEKPSIGTFTDSGTTDYYGSGSYTITPLGAYDDLQFNNGTFILGGALNSTSLTNDSTLDLNGQPLTVGGIFANNGILKLMGSETASLGSLTDNDTTDYYGSGSYTITPLGTYDNLQFNNGTFVLAGGLHSANLTNNSTLDLNGQFLTVGHALTNNGTLKLVGSETTSVGTFTDHGITEYYGSGSYTITPLGSYDNLQFNNGTFKLVGALTTASLTNKSIFDLNGQSLAVNGAFINNGTFKLQHDESISAGSYSDTGTVDYHGSGSYTGLNPFFGNIYNNLQLDSGTFTLNNTLTVNGNLTNSSTLDLAGNQLNVTGTFTNNGIFKLIGSETPSIGIFNDNGTTDYYGNGSYTITPLGVYGNLQFDNGTFTLGGTSVLVAAGNIAIGPNVTLNLIADTSIFSGNALMMDPTATINGGGFDLSISAVNASTLGNINNVNLLSFYSGSNSNVTFTSNPNSTFQATIVQTNYLSILSRSVGTGTAVDPIMIYSDSNAPGGLEYIQTNGNLGAYYELANNIDASETAQWNNGAGFMPIGNASKPFTGNFNGNFFIYGLTINTSSDYVGLFGYTSSSAILSNVVIFNENVDGGNYVGGLIGLNNGSVSISNSDGNVSGASNVGGLVGLNNGSISNMETDVNVSSNGNHAGGLAGDNEGTIIDSYSTGNVIGSDYVGGLVGNNGNGTIINSFTVGNMTGSGANVGGLTGNNNGTIINSYYTDNAYGSQGGGIYEPGGEAAFYSLAHPVYAQAADSTDPWNIVVAQSGVDNGTEDEVAWFLEEHELPHSLDEIQDLIDTGEFSLKTFMYIWNGSDKNDSWEDSKNWSTNNILIQNTYPGEVLILGNNIADGMTIVIDINNNIPVLPFNLTLVGELSIGSNVIFNPGKYEISGGDLDVSGTLLVTADNFFDNYAFDTVKLEAGSTVNYSGSSQTIAPFINGQPYYNIIASGSGSIKTLLPNSLTIFGFLFGASIYVDGSIDISPNVTLAILPNTVLTAGKAFNMDSSAIIDGEGNDLTIYAGSDSTLGNINDVKSLTLNSNSSTNVTFTLYPNSLTAKNNITFNANVTLDLTADTGLTAGNVLTMDSTATIEGEGYDLYIKASNNSTLGNIDDVNHFVLDPGNGSNVTFTSYTSPDDSENDSDFQVNTLQTKFGSVFERNEGSGTASDPIMIYSDSDAPGGLEYIGDTTNNPAGLGFYYEQANNIDASETSQWNSGAGFVPIGSNSTPFSGNYNGESHIISGLYINLNSPLIPNASLNGSTAGLFGATQTGALITSVGIVNDNIKITYGAAGGLVGINSGSIMNSYSTGSVSGSTISSDGLDIGGLVGDNFGLIINSYNTANVSGYISPNPVGNYFASAFVIVGGLVGDNFGSIINSYNSGSIFGGGIGYVGGLAGVNGGLEGQFIGSIANSYSVGMVGSTDTADVPTIPYGGFIWMGGLVGANGYSSTISNSAWWTGANGNAIGFDFNIALSDTSQGAPLQSLSSAGYGTDDGAISEFYSSGNPVYSTWDFTKPIWVFTDSSSLPILAIGKIELTVSGITVNDKTYDGTTAATDLLNFDSASLVGVLPEDIDNVTLGTSDASAVFNSKDVGTANTVFVSGLTLSGPDADNYLLIQPTLNANITPAPLKIIAVADSKQYDGTTNSEGIPLESGLLGSDTVAASQSFNSQNVLGPNASTISINPGYMINDGNNGNNYKVTLQTAGGTINPEPITISAMSETKTYDGTTTASTKPIIIQGTIYTGVGDNITPLTEAFSGKDALGTDGSTLNVGPYTITDGNGGKNYSVTLKTASGTINPEPLTITATSESKTYDSTTTASAVPTITSGTIYTGAGDRITPLTETFSNKDVLGTDGSTLNVGPYTITDGNNGADYNVTVNNATGTVSPAPLTISAASDFRQYNGTNSSTEIPTVNGLFGSDTVTGLSQKFVSKNVLGTGLSTLVVNSGYSVNDGNAGSDYTVTFQNASGTITPAPLTISAVTDTKQYDGTNNSTVTPFVSGLYSGDAVTGLRQAFASKNVLGTGGSTIAVASYAVNDGDGGADYTVRVLSTLGTINPAPLTLTATGPAITYGTGYTGGTSTNNFTYSGTVNGEAITSVTLTPNPILTATTPAGTTYTVKPSAPTGTGGFLASNYSITPVVYNGKVAPATLTLTVTAKNETKTYGTTINLTGDYTVGGLVNGNKVTSVTLTSAGAAATAPVSSSPYSIVPSNAVGTGLSNYTIIYVDGSLTVAPAALTITASNASKTYGTTADLTGFTTKGLVNGDTVNSVTLSSAGAAKTAMVTGSPYTITPSAAAGTGLSNYKITYVSGKLTVNPATLIITASNETKTFGTTINLTGDYTVSGLVNGDKVTSVTLTSRGAAARARVRRSPYRIRASAAAGTGLSNYEIIYVPGKLTINPAPLAITATNSLANTLGIRSNLPDAFLFPRTLASIF